MRAAEQGRSADAHLFFIAKTDKESSVRESSVKKLTDPALLANIAETDKDWNVCRAARQTLGDQSRKFVGGLGEHYCSKECYDLGGATITFHLLLQRTGYCSVCRKPITLQVGGRASMVCWKPGLFLFHCGSPDCVQAVKSNVQASPVCAICGKPVK